MKRITTILALAALFVTALPAAAASSDLPAIPFVPKTRAEAERCVVEVVNQLRAEHGLPALIHSNIPREPMFRYTTKRAQIPFIEDRFERRFATAHTEEEVTAFLDAIPAVKADPTKLWVYSSLLHNYYAPAGWDDACRLAADQLSVPQLDGEPHPLLTADYLLYATVAVADSYLIGNHRGEPVYSGFVTVAGWTSECWGDVELPIWKEVELCKWKHDETHTTTGFVDVPSDHVFAVDVSTLADAGITKGCNPPKNDRFCPDAPVTRGQMAAFLVRAGLAG